MPINTDTSVSLGLLATVVGFVLGGIKWLIGIKSDVDRHTEQLDSIEKKIEGQSDVVKEVSAVSERLVSVETKIDLLLYDKIK